MNSPESDIYHKSRVLYGLFQAKKSIVSDDRCFLVEGYTDVLSMHQAGIENVVASSGTALTAEQIRLIKRFTQNVTILYDGDEAGIRASFRGIDMILEEGMNVKVVMFPQGEDPDSYAQSHSSSEFLEYIKTSISKRGLPWVDGYDKLAYIPDGARLIDPRGQVCGFHLSPFDFGIVELEPLDGSADFSFDQCQRHFCVVKVLF